VRNWETVEFKQLRYFAKVGQLLNITRAAEAMGVPKSVVSKSIRQLEDNVGVQLLERSTRVVSLTEAGQLLLPRALSLLEDSQYLFSDLQTLNRDISGHLKLAAAPAFGEYLSRTIIPAFLKKWPEVRISLELSYSYENLFEKGLDLAFRFGEVKDDRLIAKNITTSTRILAASPHYLKNNPAIKVPQDLMAHSCNSIDMVDHGRSWRLKSQNQQVEVQVQGRFQCSTIEALKAATVSDMGIAQLPRFTIQNELSSGSLVCVLPHWQCRSLGVSAVYRQGLNKPAKLAAFLEFLDEYPLTIGQSPGALS